ncbi:Beta-arabinofuranosyltransferase RAY1 [Gracilariopsis chorda]|uniref:Beta-arabinofuranosyltransferase RAY1 n=1 Tax=Gracilariopsis chorda TaxID=448386 RepID=A0A2V3J6J4_9FLOR|nr:Beta-arabinofuranosyltransferase RAY1 [Gracilariopsis chorda]|eukprot:PXF50048.1 Beta-arabinofuranosyltransferase RAY1 [Gracilariopsis chorda]
MDKSVYNYLLNHRANVFFHQQTTPTLHRRPQSLSSLSESHFGTALFIETSRRKSQLVLSILRLGYNVIFSDVDVALLQNPIPHLLSYNSDIVIQSDRPHFLQDAPLNYNINSGFYLVRPSARTTTAFRAILKYSQAIRRSEQKAFNYVLCGAFKTDHAGPGLRIGTDRCTYSRTDATVCVLPLEAFPNGSDQSLWSNATTRFTEQHPNVVAVHANYVNGLAAKIDRLRTIGYWFLPSQSTQTAQCIFPS